MKEEILEKARKQRDGLEENIQKIEEENRAEMEKKLKEIKLLKKEMREKKENGDKEMKMMKEEGWKCHRKVLDHEIEQLEEEERKQKVANTERIKLLRKEMRDKGEEAKSDLDFIKKEGWLTHKVSLGKEMKRLDEEERKEKATKQETTQLQKEEMRRNRERAKRDLKALNKDGYKRQQEALIRERNKVEEEERKQMEEKQHRVKLQRWDCLLGTVTLGTLTVAPPLEECPSGCHMVNNGSISTTNLGLQHVSVLLTNNHYAPWTLKQNRKAGREPEVIREARCLPSTFPGWKSCPVMVNVNVYHRINTHTVSSQWCQCAHKVPVACTLVLDNSTTKACP
ncbi:hypothetical protein NHX12_013244 [Muraenolepis orangiensis]|uniref:Uncharacterized protein n=1 Tax=Muraenolepis orangiensis TaxID=630683 RepID=A0A9Q0DEL0_9TELE|nr:hypothetical protein NHX12_013244 [Muraenolepis orangiensis]